MTGPVITVVGGANTDIVGIPDGQYVPRDSNPGHVRVSAGGVGRNIAENLARLGAQVRLVTAFGDDESGRWLTRHCADLGIDVSHSVTAAGVPGSRYLAVLDEGADLAAAVSDMRALAALTAGALDPAAFDGVDAVVLDTNLPADTIAEAARCAGEAPIVLDPVSVAKAHAALPVLGCLTALKANLREAETLSGVTGAEGAAQRLLEAGVAQVFITMGPAGVVCADRSGIFTLMAPDVTVANATGAGDAFTAGVAWGLGTGADLGRTAAMASALSAIALESESTVSEHVSAAAVAERMEGASR